MEFDINNKKEKNLINKLDKNKINSEKTYNEILNIFQENNIKLI